MTTTARKGSRTWLLALIGVVLVAALLRGWAVLRLPLDYDEPVYLRAGFEYARALRAGDWNGVIDYAANREHPALVKLLYGLVVLVSGQDVTWAVGLYAARALSAVLGTLAVLVLALFNPLAGGMLAVHTLAIKYTGQAYLEALPHLASLGSVLAFVRSRPAGSEQSRRLPDAWFWLSALALGVTAAGKFTYLPVVLVILYLALFEKRTRWYHLLLYLAVSVATFWLLNPTLWHEPVTRLYNSLFFHVGYSQGANVEQAGLPWYQPLYWISRSSPSAWHPDLFFYPGVRRGDLSSGSGWPLLGMARAPLGGGLDCHQPALSAAVAHKMAPVYPGPDPRTVSGRSIDVDSRLPLAQGSRDLLGLVQADGP